MKVFAVIMAGGVGSRVWPISREALPKQFQNFFGDRTLYQRAYDRISQIVPPQNIFVVTNNIHRSTASEQIPQIPERNIIGEPVGRSTAPCIAAAASAISSITDNAVMVVLPADHLISQEENFLNQLKEAIRLAEKHRSLVTIGITPSYPEPGTDISISIRRKITVILLCTAATGSWLSKRNPTRILRSNIWKAGTFSGTAECLSGASM